MELSESVEYTAVQNIQTTEAVSFIKFIKYEMKYNLFQKSAIYSHYKESVVFIIQL